VHVLRAFTAMTWELGWRDAPGWLIDEVDLWEDRVREAVRRAELAGAAPECTDVTFGGAGSHRTWRASSWVILQALSMQAETAMRERLEADAVADREDRLAADAEEPAAGRHRENAAAARHRSGACMAWEVAARDAHGHGSTVLAGTQPAAVRVGEAIRQAGGIREVPRNKRYATTAGRSTR
jgi:hypothetical protein